MTRPEHQYIPILQSVWLAWETREPSRLSGWNICLKFNVKWMLQPVTKFPPHDVNFGKSIRYDTIVEFNVDSKAEYTA